MKSLIICQSTHNGNTRKVAQAMSAVLDAKILKPAEIDIESLKEYDLIGLGSGIYNFQHHKALLKLVDSVPMMSANVFLFSTRAMFPISMCHKKLKETLLRKNSHIVGEFSCTGLTTFGPARLIGGLNKGRPNARDLEHAQAFAKTLRKNH